MINSRQLFSSAFAGGQVAVFNVSICLSTAELMFAGPLDNYLPTGIVILLSSAAVLSLGGALGSGYPGMVITPRGAAAPAFAAMTTVLPPVLSRQVPSRIC